MDDMLKTKVRSVIISGYVDEVNGKDVTVGYDIISIDGRTRRQFMCHFNGNVGALTGERVYIKGEPTRGMDGIIGREFYNCEFIKE